jgi:integrase
MLSIHKADVQRVKRRIVESPKVSLWLSRLQPNTAETYRNLFNSFLNWLGTGGGKFAEFTPEQLLDYSKLGDDEKWELVDLTLEYVLTIKGTEGHIKNHLKAIKSFFKHNRCILPDDSNIRVKPTRKKVEGTLTLENIRDVILASNKLYRAVFLVMFTGGLGQDEFIRWSNEGLPSLREQLEAHQDVIRIDVAGRKKMKNRYNYYTFIGGDALNALKAYLKERDSLYPDTPEIFLTAKNTPLTTNTLYHEWMRLMKRLQIYKPEPRKDGEPPRRQGINPHEMRDVLITKWQEWNVSPQIYCEYRVGHVIDKNEYNKIYRNEPKMRDEFLNVLPYLNVLSSTKGFGLINIYEVKDHNRRIQSLESDIEILKKAKEQAESERDIQKGVADMAIKESVAETYKTHPIEDGIEEPPVMVVKKSENPVYVV